MIGRLLMLAGMVLCGLAAPAPARGAEPKSLLANGGFELGQSSWRMDKGGGTVASFAVDDREAAEGGYSALVTVGKVEEWGVQFGQGVPAGKKGRTYTFAAVARAVGAPVTVRLEIERSAKPYDRAARTEPVALPADRWTELHATFTLDKDYGEGWFAYVSCAQAHCQFRVDGFRLYEGGYVPYGQAAAEAVAGVQVFDTGAASDAALAPEAVARAAGWAEVPPGTLDHAFRGDAVVRNDKLAVVLRRKGNGLELHAGGGAGGAALPLRARLVPTASGGAAAATTLSALKLVDNAAGEVWLEAMYAGGGKAIAIACGLRMGQPMVETRPVSGAGALRVEAPCRFAVLPDFFADDMVLDARALGVAETEVPADHFLMHLLPDREAIVMTARRPADDDVKVSLSGQGDARRIDAVELPYGPEGPEQAKDRKPAIWAAVLAAPRIWHVRDVAPADAEKLLDLGWTAPFPALWRVDWRKDDGLTDSWEMIAERPDGSFFKYAWFGQAGTIGADRKRWATVLGSFRYPCWLDRNGRGYLQPLKRGVRFDGPALVYPVNRDRQTPNEQFTVVDVVRNALGVGPCEYVLDVEGQRSQNRGMATCATRDTLNPIYKDGRQKAERERIEKTLQSVVLFIRFIRSRVEQYIAFAHEVRTYLGEQKKLHPELAGPLDELDALAAKMDEYFASRRPKIKTPAEAEKMADEFRRTMMDYEGADALARCRRFTEAWVEIGGNQDELVGECRLVARMLRQRAALLAAAEPKLADVAREVRARSQKVLRNPAGHECANH